MRRQRNSKRRMSMGKASDLPTLRVVRRACGVAGLWVLVLLPFAAQAQFETIPEQLCIGDPCRVVEERQIEAGADLDFGDKELKIQAELTIDPGAPVTIRARRILVESGGVLKTHNQRSAFKGANLVLVASEDIIVDRPGAVAAIQMKGCDGGSLTLKAGAAAEEGEPSVFLNSKIEVQRRFIGCQRNGNGGMLTIESGGSVVARQQIIAVGGLVAAGGAVRISGPTPADATLPVPVPGDVELAAVEIRSGLAESPGSLEIDAAGDVTLRSVLGTGEGPFGTGGQVRISTLGSVRVIGDIRLNGTDAAENPTNGGDGGQLVIHTGTPEARQAVELLGQVLLRGRGRDGNGGRLEVKGERVVLNRFVNVSGSDKAGSVDVEATGSIRVNGAIVGTGSLGIGGSIQLVSGGNIDVRAAILASETGGGLVPGKVVLDAAGRLRISGDIATLGSRLPEPEEQNSALSVEGDRCDPSGITGIYLMGCDVDVTPAVTIATEGQGGDLCVEASGRARLQGFLELLYELRGNEDDPEIVVVHSRGCPNGDEECRVIPDPETEDEVPAEPDVRQRVLDFADNVQARDIFNPAMDRCATVPTVCNDTLDEDEDLWVGFPEEEGCYAALDETEQGRDKETCPLCDRVGRLEGRSRVRVPSLDLNRSTLASLEVHFGDGRWFAFDADGERFEGSYRIKKAKAKKRKKEIKFVLSLDPDSDVNLEKAIRETLEEGVTQEAIRILDVSQKLKGRFRKGTMKLRGSLPLKLRAAGSRRKAIYSVEFAGPAGDG